MLNQSIATKGFFQGYPVEIATRGRLRGSSLVITAYPIKDLESAIQAYAEHDSEIHNGDE